MRNRLLGIQITVLLLFQALCFASAFLVFYVSALPILGKRLHESIWRIAPPYFLTVLILLILFSAIGVLWLSLSARRKIYQPLSRMKAAAFQIRDGNLDFELPVPGRSDFSDLTAAFEEMRVHLKNSNALAERSEHERRVMIANITHDLKTPVTSILGYSEGILDGVAASPEKVMDYAAIIRGKAYAIKTLVDDLSLLALLEAAPPLALEQMEMSSWLRDFTAELAGEADADITCDAGEELRCLCDKPKIERVLLNLTGNALKYARIPGRRLTLAFTLERHGEHALLTLTDNGPGLSPGDIRAAFERFHRADASRGVVPGSGLGLSIARQIVHLHRGKIWLHNHPEGGLSVSVMLGLCPGQNGGVYENFNH